MVHLPQRCGLCVRPVLRFWDGVLPCWCNPWGAAVGLASVLLYSLGAAVPWLLPWFGPLLRALLLMGWHAVCDCDVCQICSLISCQTEN